MTTHRRIMVGLMLHTLAECAVRDGLLDVPVVELREPPELPPLVGISNNPKWRKGEKKRNKANRWR